MSSARLIVAGTSSRPLEHTTGVLDASIVASLRELGRRSNTDLLSGVAELFLRNAPERLETLERAITTEDLRAIEMTAHAFRSAAANLGATALAGQCAEIENLAREKNLGRIEKLLPALESQLDLVRNTSARVEQIRYPMIHSQGAALETLYSTQCDD